jgi:hypothetical protein
MMMMMMEKLVELMVLAGETEVLGENLPRARTRAAALGSQRLTASAMARPNFIDPMWIYTSTPPYAFMV